MNIFAKITGIKYTPFLCRKLNIFSFNELEKALSKEATAIVKIDEKNQIALSYWVSAKRTRSYPYGRVYDSLNFFGKKVTVIPIFKDEGKDGDRDFLQWDTISLMSLLGIYVIVSYYSNAEKNSKYKNKITNQRFDIEQIKSEIKKLLSYQSDALHWNLEQIDKVGKLGKMALESYGKISKVLGVDMHSGDSAEQRINELLKGKEVFMNLSRELAQKAQNREYHTTQPKEKVDGSKASLTIRNYLGGNYYFTCDEAEINGKNITLVEAKNTEDDIIPKMGDIKDGLLKMILFTNLEEVNVEGINYNPIPILKLTTKSSFDMNLLSKKWKASLILLKKEGEVNRFSVKINDSFL